MILKTKHLRALILGAMMSAGLVTVTLAPRVALAQTSKGTLTGTIRDGSGAAVVGADVTITNGATGETRVTKSDSLGAYRFDSVTPGKYILHVESAGFERFEATNVTVPPTLIASYDPILMLGRVDQTVSVSADNVLMDRENGSLSGTISEVEMAKVPIFSLNPIEVLTTVPGVQIVSNTDFSQGQSVQVSGARPRANNFLIDGEEINDPGIGGQAVQPQIPDMYTDVVIYTHNPPAEFGRASGGVVNLITKGGTNSFHGSAWELYSGSGLNSADGQTRQLVPKDRVNKARSDEHQYGFTAGGPVIKNKLFAFGAVQWARIYGNEASPSITLPTQNGKDLLTQIAGGSNATTAANAKLLLGYLSNASYLATFAQADPTINAFSVNLGAACPSAPTQTCGLELNTFQRPPTPELSPDTQWTYRVDYTPWAKDTFSARYLHDRTSLTPDFFANGGTLPGFDTLQGGTSELGQGAWTHTFSSSIINEFRVSETRASFAFSPTAETKANPLYTAPTLFFTNLYAPLGLGFNQNFPQGTGQDMYQLQDTASWVFGHHTIRVGADLGRRLEKDLVSQNANGSLTFSDDGSGGSAEGNFLLNQLGSSGTARITFGNTRFDPHSWRSGFFGQDDFKVTPYFTLNLGFRYDYFTPPENAMKYPAINPFDTTSPIDTIIPVAADKNNIAPRVGFAYTPHIGKWLSGGNTVVRGGYGIFFDSDFSNIATNSIQSAPNAVAGTLTSTDPNGLGNATALIPTIPKVLTPNASVTSVVNNLLAPRTQEWNLGIERQLPGQFGLTVTYVGSLGAELFANQQFNFFDFTTKKRLNPARGIINARDNTGSSNYQGLEVGVKHNFSRGFFVTGAYNYSKALDNASEVFAPDSDSTSYSADLRPGGRRFDWGPSAFDHRQYAAIAYVWTPKGLRSDSKGTNMVLSGLTRHWTISGTSRFQSGAYSTVNVNGLDLNGDGSTSNDRPILSNKNAPFNSVGIDGHFGPSFLGGPATTGVYYDVLANNTTGAITPIDPSTVHWLIPYGPNLAPNEIGRNSFLNHGTMYNDMALEKAIPVGLLHLDRGQFILRAEVKNLANHNNIGLFNFQAMDLLNDGTSTFLSVANAREGSGPGKDRELRFWAKFSF